MVGAGRLLPPGGVKSLRRTGSVPKAYYPRPGADFFLAREQSPPRAGLAASFAPWWRQEPAPDRVCTKSVLSPPRRRLFSCQGTKSAPRRVGSVFCPLVASRACAGPGLYQKRTIPAPVQTFFLPGNKMHLVIPLFSSFRLCAGLLLVGAGTPLQEGRGPAIPIALLLFSVQGDACSAEEKSFLKDGGRGGKGTFVHKSSLPPTKSKFPPYSFAARRARAAWSRRRWLELPRNWSSRSRSSST